MKRRTFIQLSAAGGLVAAAPIAWRLLRRGRRVAPTPAAHARAAAPPRRFADREGNLYDVHAAAGRIDVLSADGRLHAQTRAPLGYPVSMSVDAAGRLFVLERGTGRIRLLDRSGAIVGELGAGLALRSPGDLACGGDLVAVADTLRHRVLLLEPGGRVVARLGEDAVGKLRLNGPSSVAIAPGGAVYVADSGNARVMVFAASGRLLDVFGGYGRGPGQLLSASCVRLDAGGDAYVSDRVGGCVLRFDAAHRYRARLTPTLPGGARADVRWLSNRADGSILYTLEPTARV